MTIANVYDWHKIKKKKQKKECWRILPQIRIWTHVCLEVCGMN